MKNMKIFIICNFLLFFSFALQAQGNNSNGWDKQIIEEADIWKNLLVGYIYEDRNSHWPKRKEALTRIISDYPNSKWTDDAELLLAGEKAIMEDDIEGAINELKEIIKKYPSESTIVTSWNYEKGCLISEAWLMWAPGLVSYNEDESIKTSFPFDKDSSISILENEVLTYFEHIQKYPQKTKDVAQYIIALMLRHLGKNDEAISELKNFQNTYPDLSKVKEHDFNAANRPYGYLIENEPPFDEFPIWRVQYAASLLLIELYSQQNDIENVKKLSSKIISECSSDGWYWNINKYAGDIYAKNNLKKQAIEQYDLAINGIKNKSKKKGDRHNVLYQNGYLIKSKDFISWEDEAIKSNSNAISEIKLLRDNLKSSE